MLLLRFQKEVHIFFISIRLLKRIWEKVSCSDAQHCLHNIKKRENYDLENVISFPAHKLKLIFSSTKGTLEGEWMQQRVFTAGDWSADLISSVQLSSPLFWCCTGCYSELIQLIWADYEGWLGQRSSTWSRPGLSLFVSLSLFLTATTPPPPTISFPPLLFCQTCGLQQGGSDVHRTFFFLNKRVRGFTQTQMFEWSSPASTHIYCSLWPKQLVFVVKRLIRKKYPFVRVLLNPNIRSTASQLYFVVQILFSISVVPTNLS